MICKLHKCKGACCYNIVLPIGYLQKYADKIINPVIGVKYMGENKSRELPESELAITSPDPEDNRCPFLKSNYKCNIYADRPQICRMFGEGNHPMLKCRYLNQG